MNILATSKQIDQEINKLAKEIITTYRNEQPLFVALLRGAMPFASRLMFEVASQAPDMHPQLDYMMTTTYGDGREALTPHIAIDLLENTKVERRTVIILDDVLDKGVTASLIASHLLDKGASAVKLYVLVEKDIVRQNAKHADYACFHVGPEWLVGMGLDDASTAKDGYRWLDEVRIVS